jgi:thiamine pyrophosphate-dependent acetolactate synthase large subunit-like protein
MMIRRIDAIRQIMADVTDELVVATTGHISRELFVVRDRPENFYMCGSMGMALPIALGVALNTDRQVICLNGDGAALMALSAMVVVRHLRPKNLVHYVLDNGTYASTGGQPTASGSVEFPALGEVRVIPVEPGNEPDTPRIDIPPPEIVRRFMAAVAEKQ